MHRSLSLAAAAALLLLAPAVSRADDDDRWRDDDWRWRRDGYRYGGAHQFGFNEGYGEGLKEGRKDRDKRRSFELYREDRYRDGDHGYKSRYGSRWDYVRGFRGGYERGYREGYSVYAYAPRGRDGNRVVWDPYLGRYRYENGSYRNGRDGYGWYADGDPYDWQADGRHRHHGGDGWCSARH
jgi:hypothetical protein